MKKTNTIFVAVVIVVSIFLLWLWYYLNFPLLDDPLDLVLSIIWWVIVGGFIFAITKIEQRRQQRIRTIYLAQDEMFNSEEGLLPFESKDELVDSIKELLDDLKYNFKRKDFPEPEDFAPTCLIRTLKLKTKDDDDDEWEWEGEFVNVITKMEYEFGNEEELRELIKSEFVM